MRLTISTGNSKLGTIPNISLMPIKSCPPGVPCAKLCYCNRALVQYPAVRRAWGDNQKLWEQNEIRYFRQLKDYLAKHRPRLFRYHVGGDVPDSTYFINMLHIADLFKETEFLAYTKNFLLPELTAPTPTNLTVILSMWPGQPDPGLNGFRRSWLSHDPRAPLSAFPCPGKCSVCGYCWGQDRDDIKFDLH